MDSLNVLVVDEESNARHLLAVCLESEGHQVVAVSTAELALDEIAQRSFDLIFLDRRVMSKGNFRPNANAWTWMIDLTANAIYHGPSDYLLKPFDIAQVLHIAQTVTHRRQLERQIRSLQTTLAEQDHEVDQHAINPVMKKQLDLARRVAQSQTHLTIGGEVGSNKAELARAIHRWSDRADQPLGIIRCGSSTFEADLFAAGGKADSCDGGTLILEAVDRIPLPLQLRILWLLKDREFELADQTTRRVNLRIVATTDADLQKSVDAGTFRADLLMTLDILRIDIPPLRNRPEDIPAMAERYLAIAARQNHRNLTGFTLQAMHALTQYRWPGNVRELRNLIERAALLCGDEIIGVEHLPPNLLNVGSAISIGDLVPLAKVEEQHVRQVVASAKSLRQAAGILDMDAATVVRRMQRYKKEMN